jgi:DNA-binding transcriptional LysR family regulator
MDLLGTLKVLVRVTETGSFSAVARERNLTQAAVAKQVAQLEETFGVRLFHRTTRKLSLTDDGRTLLELARPVLDGVEIIEASLGRQSASPVGLVRVGVTGTASHFLAERLPSLLADNQGLKVELVESDRFGDMVEDRQPTAIRNFPGFRPAAAAWMTFSAAASIPNACTFMRGGQGQARRLWRPSSYWKECATESAYST